jgi:hypothetical protein
MIQNITKKVIEESTPEQLTEMYYGLVKALSLRSAQGMGTDEVLSEMVAEVVAKMNTYTYASARASQQPPTA